MAIIQTPSIAAVVEDQTPQLGGNLDCQDYQLQWSGSSQFIGSLVATAGLNISSGSNNIQLTSNGIIDINTNGASRAKFEASGGLSVDGAVAPMSVDSLYDLGKTALRWNTVYADSLTIGDGVDAILTADAANELALKNSTNAQALHVYNTDDGVNYERLEVKWDTNVATISTSAAGTGSPRLLSIEGADGTRIFTSSNNMDFTGTANRAWKQLYPISDGSLSLGIDALRWSNTYTDSITIGDGVDAILTADAADELALRNGANGQSFAVYGSYTDSSNYQRLKIHYDGSNNFTIGEERSGTGSGSTVTIKRNGSSVASWASEGMISTARIRPGGDGIYDLGKTDRRWANTYTDTITIGDGVDAVLTADAADTLALRNGTNAQQFNVYNTYTDASNYERLKFDATGSLYQIQPEAAGTGNSRALHINGPLGTTEGHIRLLSNGTGYLRWGTEESLKWDSGVVDIDADLTVKDSNAFYLNNTYTDASNYERLEVKWDTNEAQVATTKDGTGQFRSVYTGILDGSTKRQGFLMDSTLASSYWSLGSQCYVFSSTNFRPNGSRTLGNSSSRWATTYTKGIATDVETFTAASDTLDTENNVALCDCTSNNITINLPAASTASGLQYHIKKIDSSSNTVTVDGNGAETIDGATTQVISSQYDSMTIVSDGSNWFII